MKDNDFKLLRGFDDGRTDICDCRVAFATENSNRSIELNIKEKSSHFKSHSPTYKVMLMDSISKQIDTNNFTDIICCGFKEEKADVNDASRSLTTCLVQYLDCGQKEGN